MRNGNEATPAAALELFGATGANFRVLQSCNSIWLFDEGLMRFRRAPRGTRLDMPSPASEWKAYYRLDADCGLGAFSVCLNEAGTQVLRSRLHGDPCPHCAVDGTGEISLAGLTAGAREPLAKRDLSVE